MARRISLISSGEKNRLFIFVASGVIAGLNHNPDGLNVVLARQHCYR